MHANPVLTASDLRGVIVPLVTPFTSDGAVDEPSFIALVEWLLAEGVDGFVLAGTTGESPTLRWPEVERLLDVLRGVVRARVPILVGTGTNDTAESVERTERARLLGADAAFAVTPYYSRPAAAGVIEHYRRIAAVGLPTVAYHIPYRTGLTLDLASLRAILALPGIVGLKESSGGVHNVAPLARPGGPAILCGEDALFLDALAAGAAGGILAVANLVPRPLVALHRAFVEGRPIAAEAIATRLRPLVDALFAEPNPAPVKHALARQRRIADPALRLPLTPISPALDERLAALLAPSAGAPAAMTEAEIAGLVERFLAAEIPATEWTHTAHLVCGAWQVFHQGPDEALVRMREGLLRLNRAHGTPETPTRGYHETITRAYLQLLAAFLDGFAQSTPLPERIAALLASPLCARDRLLRHYQRERLMSPEARAAWLPPEQPLLP